MPTLTSKQANYGNLHRCCRHCGLRRLSVRRRNECLAPSLRIRPRTAGRHMGLPLPKGKETLERRIRLFEKSNFVERRCPIQNRVPVGKTAKALDDIAMTFGECNQAAEDVLRFRIDFICELVK